MTIDEAIKKYEENAKRTWNGKPTVAAEECQQMAEWLKDYKRLLGAIEDIKTEIAEYLQEEGFGSEYRKDVMQIIDRHISGKEQE